MSTTTFIVRMFIRIAFLFQLVLGAYLVVTGHRAGLPLHIGVGLLLIASLWMLTLLASRAHVGFGPSLAVVVLTLALPVLGIAQLFVSAGVGHWVLMALHVAIAVAAIGLAERIGKQAQTRFTLGHAGHNGAPGPQSGAIGHAEA